MPIHPFAAKMAKLPELRDENADQYREFAAECYRLVAEAKEEGHQRILREMARAWRELAEQAEGRER